MRNWNALADDDFRVRLRTRWDDWARAGTPLELLVQIYFAGYTGVAIIQQNGLMYTLSAPPTPGQDPTSLLVITHMSTLIAPMTSPVSDMVVPITSVTSYSAGATVPTPWWTFDPHNEVSSRFIVVVDPPITGDNTLKQIITTWKNASAYCVGVYSFTSGVFFGYPLPVHTFGDGSVFGTGVYSFLAIGA